MSAQKNEKPGLQARRAAISLLQGVTLDQQPLDQLLETNAEFRELEARDRSFAHALVASSLRHGGEIKAILGKFLTKPLPRSSGMTVDILTVATAQLLFMDVSPHAVIDLSVDLAKQDRKAQHFSGLINAVLRKVSTDGKAVLKNTDGPRLNTPDWLWEQWVSAYGEETARDIATSHLLEAPLDISVKGKPEYWASELGGELLPTGTIRLTSADRNLQDLPGFRDGEWWVQDAASALPAKLLGDIKGQSVLDLCAAPGGKTAQLASAGAVVTAVDDSPSRMKRLQENLVRLKLSARTLIADVLSLPADTPYDNVLLDAPCTATGTIRRHPDLVYLKSPQQLTGLVGLQQKMLERAASLVRPGGRLVYCTCSLSPLEGERQVFKFLRAHENFVLAPITPKDLARQEQLITPAGVMRCLPSLTIGTSPGLDGFFAARLDRLSS